MIALLLALWAVDTVGFRLPSASDVPTGDDPATVDRFYSWLMEHYLNRNPNSSLESTNVLGEDPTWDLGWAGPPLQVLVVGAALIGVFWVFAWFFNHPRREQKMLYKPASFSGALTERHGKFGWFNRILYVAVIAWALYYPIEHVLTGQVY